MVSIEVCRWWLSLCKLCKSVENSCTFQHGRILWKIWRYGIPGKWEHFLDLVRFVCLDMLVGRNIWRMLLLLHTVCLY